MNKKSFFGGLAIGLAGILAVGAMGWFTKGFREWKKEEKPEIDNPIEDSSGGTEIESGEEKGVKLSVRKLMSSEFDDYGVSELAESAYTLTATITPADAANKAVDWTIAFKNASSTWASGKTVTDYATVTPSADGALTAVVENVAAFGEQIVVKATSRDNAEAYATCTVEYLQRTTG